MVFGLIDGSKIYLQNIDGDGLKEVGFTIYKDKYSKYRMYRIIRKMKK
jgi:hypothetical protein